MSLRKNIKKYWDYLEQKYPRPEYVGQIKYLEFKDLKEAVDSKNERFIKKIIRNMYVKKEGCDPWCRFCENLGEDLYKV